MFGWRFEEYGDEYASYEDGRISGGFYRSDNVGSVKTGSVLVVFYREHLEESVEIVDELGGTIVRPIFEFPGGRRFHFTEPGGGEYAIWSDQ